jgi:hypothetical protein
LESRVLYFLVFLSFEPGCQGRTEEARHPINLTAISPTLIVTVLLVMLSSQCLLIRRTIAILKPLIFCLFEKLALEQDGMARLETNNSKGQFLHAVKILSMSTEPACGVATLAAFDKPVFIFGEEAAVTICQPEIRDSLVEAHILMRASEAIQSSLIRVNRICVFSMRMMRTRSRDCVKTTPKTVPMARWTDRQGLLFMN